MRITRAVRAIVALEIRMLLRDVRTVLMSVVLPVVLIPVMLLAGEWMEGRRAEREDARVYRVAFTGPDSALAHGLAAGAFAEEEGDRSAARFRVVATDEPVVALETGELDLYVEALPAEPGRAVAESDALPERERIPEGYEEAPVLRIHYLSTRRASQEGSGLLREHLEERREARRGERMVDAGFPVSLAEVGVVDAVNVAPAEEVQAARLGRILTVVLLGLMVLGGSAVATDTLAGEKERGTLSTLLTAAATRREIVTGKLLAIMAVALGIALVQLLNLWIFLGLGVLDTGAFAASVSPGLALGLLVLYLPVVALTAGVLLLSSAYANSYREAQLYLMPVLLGLLLPALAPMMPEITLRSAIVALPIANVSIAARDLLVGDVDLPFVAIAWLVTAFAAAWVTAQSVRALNDEQLVTGETSREEFLGGPDLFRRRILRWFLVFWAVKILLDLNLAVDDVRIAALLNVGVPFLLFPLLLIRHFRLDPVEALALRGVRPGVWLGVLIGAPAGLVTAGAVFRLLDLVIPVPSQLLEEFGQVLMPEGIPLWQLFIFIAVVPGITEELTFRGVLLHGLRRRFGPVGLALVVGLIFGVFHFQLFRIPSTAVLGMVLTVVTLLTGSILPAIVWHTLNNGLALYLGSREVELAMDSWWWAAGALAALALAFWIIWINRTPYPDVGPRRKREGGPG